MEHIFNIAINVEDERIVRSIEEKAEKQIINTLTEKTLDVISDRGWGGRTDNRDFERLHKMVHEIVESVVRENKDLIIKEAINSVARKIYGSKACKEAVAQMANKED